jgi:hypothetical protein
MTVQAEPVHIHHGRSYARPPTPKSLRGARFVAVLPMGLGVLLAGVYLVWQPPSIDLAAAQYRAALFGRAGFTLWDLSWYGGHYMPAYSVFVPALSWLIGTPWLGAAAVVSSVGLFQRLLGKATTATALSTSWLGLGVLSSLVSGRITFTAGIPLSLVALVCARTSGSHRRLAMMGALGFSVLTAMASPVSALFLALAWTARCLTDDTAASRLRDGALIVATFLPIAVLNLAFPETGVEPLALTALLPVGIYTAFAVPLLRRHRTLVIGVLLYAAACLVTWRLHSPVGANVLRLGPLCGGPILAWELWPRRRAWLLVLALPLLWWQWSPAISDVRSASTGPTTSAAFYRPLLRELDTLSGSARATADGGFRVEIPFTRLHWEARWVAPHYPLARGWERQVDIADNPVFYARPLTAPAYRAWLDENAVRYVALPDAALDYSAIGERRVILSRPRYLRLLWRDAHWRVYAVRRAQPILPRPFVLRSMTSDAITLTAPAAGTGILRVRWTPYWAISTGSGCVSSAGGWTRLNVRRGGRIRLTLRFAIGRVASTSPRGT